MSGKKESNKVFIPLKQDVHLTIMVDVGKKESNKVFISLKQDVHLMIMVDVTYNIYSIHSIILPHVL